MVMELLIVKINVLMKLAQKKIAVVRIGADDGIF
jgi:hypothetical protein